MPTRVTLDALAQWLLERDDIALLGHVSPDGDATGSNLAVWHALRALGKRAVVCLPEGVPGLYDWLPGADAVISTGDPLPFEPKAALSIDVSDMGRLGEAGLQLFNGCPDRAALDHHGTNPGMGDIYALDAEAAAAGEMALEMIERMGVKLSREMAECLFVAISTDCGQFNYSNTRPQTLQAAAKCVAAGIDVAELTRRLYRSRTYGRTKLLGLTLAGLEVSPDGRLAWARITGDTLREARATWEDNEGIVNYLVEIQGVDIAVLAQQRGENEVKFSLRSKAPFDVARDIAQPLGGGGHSRAAGLTLEMDLEAALQRVLALARKALDEL